MGKKCIIYAGAPALCLCLAAVLLPATPRAALAAASIEFTYVPPYGSSDDLQGRAGGVAPSEYKVAVYIYVSGWWTKPYWNSPLTTVQSDGAWTCDITTGGEDTSATRIAAYLVPNGYSPPLMSGGQTLPSSLDQNSVASVRVDRYQYRTLQFSGRTWKVKASGSRVEPGPNYFSDSAADVWVDGSDRLHLKIVYGSGRWYSTEVFTADTLGYGTYTFTLASRVDLLDKNVVLGLFTWDDAAPAYNYREIDIEFSRWGEDAGKEAQFVMQPWQTSGNRHRYSMALQGNYSTHAFIWGADDVQFSSFQGRDSPPAPADEIEFWLYTGNDTPPDGGEVAARINLWLLDGSPPSDGQEVEVVVESFKYDGPAPASTPTPVPTPSSSDAVRFAVIGDYGTGDQAALGVANLVKSWSPDIVITTGDNNYPDGASSTIDKNIGRFYHGFIYPYTGGYGAGSNPNRFFPSMGNHDWYTTDAQPYLDYFALPGNERYYDFTLGPVHFFAVDSDSSEPDGATANSIQASWLQNKLGASSSPWKVVYLHHSPFSSGAVHGSKSRMQWPYQAWGATAVLGGHDHTYERVVRNGFPYFVNGLGGAGRYGFGSPVSGSQVRYNGDWGAMLGEATTNYLSFRFITRTGTVIDRYTIYSPSPSNIRINFQPSTQLAPGGYNEDCGRAYGFGGEYGWR